MVDWGDTERPLGPPLGHVLGLQAARDMIAGMGLDMVEAHEPGDAAAQSSGDRRREALATSGLTVRRDVRAHRVVREPRLLVRHDVLDAFLPLRGVPRAQALMSHVVVLWDGVRADDHLAARTSPA